MGRLVPWRALSFLRGSSRQVAGAISAGVLTSLIVSGMAVAAGGRATVRTGRGCYVVGQSVTVLGSGFARNRTFEVAIDGIDFGRQKTNATGAFRQSLTPGGLR